MSGSGNPTESDGVGFPFSAVFVEGGHESDGNLLRAMPLDLVPLHHVDDLSIFRIATDGEEGGYPTKYSRALSVASRSWPANTVVRSWGLVEF